MLGYPTTQTVSSAPSSSTSCTQSNIIKLQDKCPGSVIDKKTVGKDLGEVVGEVEKCKKELKQKVYLYFIDEKLSFNPFIVHAISLFVAILFPH